MALQSLGSKDNTYKGLETFEAPKDVRKVTLVSDEVTAVCPVTGQPDWYTVKVEYVPNRLCVESKTFKLFLHSLRSMGMFCEALAEFIGKEVSQATNAYKVVVTITQKPRGGVTIVAESETSMN